MEQGRSFTYLLCGWYIFTKAYEITEEDHYQPRRRRGSSDSGSSFGSNRGSSSHYSTDTELEIDPVSRCPICNLPIELRNPEIEKIAVIFNQMMSHRMKMWRAIRQSSVTRHLCHLDSGLSVSLFSLPTCLHLCHRRKFGACLLDSECHVRLKNFLNLRNASVSMKAFIFWITCILHDLCRITRYFWVFLDHKIFL